MKAFLRMTLGVCAAAAILMPVAAAQSAPQKLTPPAVTPPGARHLVWQYKFNPATNQRRDWVQQGTGEWMELYPDGHSTRLTVIDKQTELHGVKGVTVIDPGRLKAFIPDAGVTGPYAKMLYFIDLTSDTGEWQVLGFFTEQP